MAACVQIKLYGGTVAGPMYEESQVTVGQLLLDPNNFRFQDEADWVRADPQRFAEQTVQERAGKRLRSENLVELKNSILSNGFLAVERLVVRNYGTNTKNGKNQYLVLEGNRRLAALQWIKQDLEAGGKIPQNVKDVLDAVPVIIITSDDDTGTYLAIMGIRHVGGIKQWGGYQRAKLVADLRDLHGYDTTEVADRLGMSKHEVNRRYRALKALQQMQEDEEYADYASSRMYPIFHEAVSLPIVRNWLGWDDTQMTFNKDEERGHFYSLITPSYEDDQDETTDAEIPPKISTYAQVRELRSVLPNPEATQLLLDSSRTFNEALVIAQAEELSRTWMTQVSEAVGSLSSMSVFDLENLDDDGLAIVTKIAEVAQHLLTQRQKLVTI